MNLVGDIIINSDTIVSIDGVNYIYNSKNKKDYLTITETQEKSFIERSILIGKTRNVEPVIATFSNRKFFILNNANKNSYRTHNRINNIISFKNKIENIIPSINNYYNKIAADEMSKSESKGKFIIIERALDGKGKGPNFEFVSNYFRFNINIQTDVYYEVSYLEAVQYYSWQHLFYQSKSSTKVIIPNKKFIIGIDNCDIVENYIKDFVNELGSYSIISRYKI